MNRIIKHRKLHGLKELSEPTWLQLGGTLADNTPLSYFLDLMNDGDRVHYCGPLKTMTREFMKEPLLKGWKFGREFEFKHRTAIYTKGEGEEEREVSVKLISHRESWFPDCEDCVTAIGAWRALESEWRSTGLPLMSTPRASGIALLWESLPRDVEFPALPDDLAKLIRANSPQHRIEMFNNVAHLDWFKAGADESKLYGYDGRWMYAAFCGLDRFPIGAPRRAEGFTLYAPGIYDVRVRIPNGWDHIGLIPLRREDGAGWEYPKGGGRVFRTWAFEPELTLALKNGWEIFDFHDGYTFDKGRPLAGWSAKLIAMRENLKAQGEINESAACGFAAAAIRQILNHCIGALHKNEYQRETFISDDNFGKWRRENPHLAEGDDVSRVEGGFMVPCWVPDTSQFSIYMAHWSSALYSLARARVAKWALRCDPSTLVKIHGDAIYSTCEQPELDKLDDGKTIGRPRRKL